MKDNKIGNILKSLRIRDGLTQEELAKKLKYSRSIISMYESGDRKPPIDVLEELADFFNVDMNYITGQMGQNYCENLKTKQIAHMIKENPALYRLLDVAKNSDEKHIEVAEKLLNNLKEKEGK
ncbi:MAG TPA: helix-turn-helix domain-containing protein [Clostridia bacterium]|nr:helix-turn-helix domain-containing protein [Clostridia bacterium]